MIETNIQGIPCLIEITAYSKPVPSNRNVDPHRDPYDPGEFEYEVYDRKGYPADWLARKIDSEDDARIYQAYMDEFEDAKAEAQLARAGY